VRADVSNLTDLDTMFAAIKQEFGHLDGVFVNAGYSEFLLFEDVTEQSFDKVIAINFTRGLLHEFKKPCRYSGKSSVIINASVGRAEGIGRHLDRLDLQGPRSSSRSNPQRRTRGPRDSREYPKPRPTDTAMFGRFPGEEQGEAVKDVLRIKPIQASGWPIRWKSRSLAVLPRVGRFCVRRRGRLPDRRRVTAISSVGA